MKILALQSCSFAGLGICLMVFAVGPRAEWGDFEGQVWGGADGEEVSVPSDCDYCGEWQNQTISCIVEDGEEIECSLHSGEQSLGSCEGIVCVKKTGAETDYECPTAEVRELANGAHRAKTKSESSTLRTRPCFDEPAQSGGTPEFCKCQSDTIGGGSSRTVTVSKDCFRVVTCFTDVGECVPGAGNKHYCTNASAAETDPKDHEYPSDDFPCPSTAEVDQALQTCTDNNEND